MELLIEYLIDNNYIQPDEKGFIKYGMEVLILNFLSIFSIIMVSLITNNIKIGISFIVNFIMIRTHLGGFHCKKPLNCIMSFPIIYYLMVHNLNKFFLQIILKIVLIILPIMVTLTPINNNTSIEKKNFKRCKYILKFLVIFYFFIDLMAVILNMNNLILRGMNYSIMLSFVLYFFEKIIRLLKIR